MADFEFPRDFDPQRVNWDTGLGEDGDIGLDPNMPGYVVRRADIFPSWAWNPRTNLWEPDEPGNEPYQQAAEQARLQTGLATQELALLQGSGVQLPRHSSYGILDDRSVVSYIYAELLEGEQFDPANPEHGQFVEPYVRANIRYLGAKALGGTIAFDAVMARNSTATTSGLILHDLDPFVEPLTISEPAEPASNYQYALQDLAATVTAAASAGSLSQERAGQLLGEVSALADK